MATVMLAGIKISGIMLGLSPVVTVTIVSVITVIYASIGGFKGVIYTDFFSIWHSYDRYDHRLYLHSEFT